MRRREFLDISDRDKGMLVDRVFVEEIPDHTASDFLKIRKYFSEQSDFVHGEQSVVDTLSILHHVQDQAAGPRMVDEHAVRRRNPPADSREGSRIEARFFPVCFSESLEHVEGIRKIG